MTIRRVRPAVNIEQRGYGRALSQDLARRQQHPAFTLAQLGLEGHAHRHGGHERQMCGAVGDLEAVQVDLGGFGGTLGNGGQPLVRGRESRHHPLRIVELSRHLTRQRHPEQAHATAHGVQQAERALVCPDRTPRKAAHVQIARHDVARRKIPGGIEPRPLTILSKQEEVRVFGVDAARWPTDPREPYPVRVNGEVADGGRPARQLNGRLVRLRLPHSRHDRQPEHVLPPHQRVLLGGTRHEQHAAGVGLPLVIGYVVGRSVPDSCFAAAQVMQVQAVRLLRQQAAPV